MLSLLFTRQQGTWEIAGVQQNSCPIGVGDALLANHYKFTSKMLPKQPKPDAGTCSVLLWGGTTPLGDGHAGPVCPIPGQR